MNTSFVILVAEDDDNDIFILRQAFKRAGVFDPVHSVEDGQQAIEYLAGAGDYQDRTIYPLPSLAIFDIKMPRKGGFEALEWVRQQRDFQQLPVMMFSSSGEPCDINRAYELGANAYMIKGAGIKELTAAVGKACTFWKATAQAQKPLSTVNLYIRDFKNTRLSV